MSHLLHVLPLISLHELTPITDAYQWNAMTIWNRLYPGDYTFSAWMADAQSTKTRYAYASNSSSLNYLSNNTNSH